MRVIEADRKVVVSRNVRKIGDAQPLERLDLIFAAALAIPIGMQPCAKFCFMDSVSARYAFISGSRRTLGLSIDISSPSWAYRNKSTS